MLNDLILDENEFVKKAVEIVIEQLDKKQLPNKLAEFKNKVDDRRKKLAEFKERIKKLKKDDPAYEKHSTFITKVERVEARYAEDRRLIVKREVADDFVEIGRKVYGLLLGE